jgi:hypothetical protein
MTKNDAVFIISPLRRLAMGVCVGCQGCQWVGARGGEPERTRLLSQWQRLAAHAAELGGGDCTGSRSGRDGEPDNAQYRDLLAVAAFDQVQLGERLADY